MKSADAGNDPDVVCNYALIKVEGTWEIRVNYPRKFNIFFTPLPTFTSLTRTCENPCQLSNSLPPPPPRFFLVFLSSGFIYLVLALVAHVYYCLFVFFLFVWSFRLFGSRFVPLRHIILHWNFLHLTPPPQLLYLSKDGSMNPLPCVPMPYRRALLEWADGGGAIYTMWIKKQGSVWPG